MFDTRIIRRLAYDSNYQRAIELIMDIIENKGSRCAFKSLDNTFCPEAKKRIDEVEINRDALKVGLEVAEKYRGIAEKKLKNIKLYCEGQNLKADYTACEVLSIIDKKEE